MKKVFSIILALLIVAGFNVSAFADTPNNPNLPRVVDYADILQTEEEQNLELLASKFAEEYDADFVIYTDSSSHGKSDEAGAEDFYDENGYGVGSDNNGIICYICLEENNSFVYTSGCGRSAELLDYNNINIIDDAVIDYYIAGDFYKGLLLYTDFVNELYKHGSLYDESTHTIYIGGGQYYTYSEDEPNQDVPKKQSALNMIPGAGLISVAVGLAFGIVSKSKAEKSMKTIANASRAEGYIVPGSFNLTRAENIFLTMTVNRVPKAQPPENRSGGGGMHSGGSSFSAPHFSGGGSIHSGGGRHF